MKILRKILGLSMLVSTVMVVTGCSRNTTEVWDDTKTAGRYVERGLRTIGGKQGDSRQVYSRGQFASTTSFDEEFIPLEDVAGYTPMAVSNKEIIPQSHQTPGEPNSTLPGIEAFADPATQSELASLFENIHFPYNSNLIKGEENLVIAEKIARHLKNHPNVYVFIEGHCDERGPEAYNLALGTRRSNSVRTILVQKGVDPDHLFTISYGKERPLVLGDTESARSLNRRAQFKVYSRS